MDLSRPVTYRGTNLNSLSALAPETPMQGYLLQDARFLDVEGWGYKEKRSQGDGYDSGRVYLGARRIVLRGTLFALTIPEWHDKTRLLRALFTPTLAFRASPTTLGYMPLTFSIPTADTVKYPSGYIEVKLNVRPVDQPGNVFPREMAFGKANGGFSAIWEVMFEAVDPRIYAQTTTDIEATTTTADSATINKGDYPAPLNAVLGLLAATDTGQRTITFTGCGTVMTVTIPASSYNRQVNVDSEKKVVTLTDNGVETLRMDLIDFDAGYTWPEVQPGSNNYEWATVGGAPDAGSKFWFYETYA